MYERKSHAYSEKKRDGNHCGDVNISLHRERSREFSARSMKRVIECFSEKLGTNNLVTRILGASLLRGVSTLFRTLYYWT